MNENMHIRNPCYRYFDYFFYDKCYSSNMWTVELVQMDSGLETAM